MRVPAEIARLAAELDAVRHDACADPLNGWLTGSHPLSVHRAAVALAVALDELDPKVRGFTLPELAEVWP